MPDALFERNRAVVLAPKIGTQSTNLDLASGPEKRGGSQALTPRSHPNRLAVVPPFRVVILAPHADLYERGSVHFFFDENQDFETLGVLTF